MNQAAEIERPAGGPGGTAATAASDWAVDLAHVAKTYKGRFGRGAVHALRGITMQVHRGAVFGLLGPNGAGKSTLVKIMMTVVRPTRCEGTMLGAAIGDKATLGRVGYLPEHHRFPDYLTGWQVLDYFGALARVPRRQRIRRGDELLELVGMTAWKDKRVKGYSKGMRQRLGVANALINNPDLVVLDEPTDGVDPVGRRDIRNVLLKLRDQGKTVFLNSHLLSELEMICDRVAILVQGVVSAQGSIDDLTKHSRRYEIEVAAAATTAPLATFLSEALSPMATLGPMEETSAVILAGAAGNGSAAPAAAGTLAVIKGSLHTGSPITVEIGRQAVGAAPALLKVGTDDAEAIQPLLDLLRARGMTIRAVRPVRSSLEDLFMAAVTDPSTGEVLPPGAGFAASKKGRSR